MWSKNHDLEISTPEQLAELIKDSIGISGKEEIDLTKLKFVIYVRKSTDDKNKQVRSLSDQIIECEEHAERNDLKIVDRIIESESAKVPDIRPKFRAMLEKLKKGEYDGIIAWHPDRLARNMKEAGEIIDLIDQSIIKSLQFSSFSFENSPAGLMTLGITFVISKQYSDQLSLNIKRGNKRAILEGKYLRAPKHGYIKDRNQFIRPDGNNYSIIKRAFQMRLQKEKIDSIVEFINHSSYTRVDAKGRRIQDYKIDKKRVSEMLKEPFYAGVYKHGDQVIVLENLYDFAPMLTVSEFLLINKVEKNSLFGSAYKHKGQRKADLLRGLVFCGDCNEPFVSGLTRKSNKKGMTNYYYYRCDTPECPFSKKSVRAHVIVNALVQLVGSYEFANKKTYDLYTQQMAVVIKQKCKEYDSLLRSLRQSKAHVEKLMSKTKDAIRDENDLTIKAIFKKDLKSQQYKLNQIEAAILKATEEKEKNSTVLLKYDQFIELFKKMAKIVEKTKSIEKLDLILREIILNCTVQNKKVTEIKLKSPFKEMVAAVDLDKVLIGTPSWT